MRRRNFIFRSVALFLIPAMLQEPAAAYFQFANFSPQSKIENRRSEIPFASQALASPAITHHRILAVSALIGALAITAGVVVQQHHHFSKEFVISAWFGLTALVYGMAYGRTYNSSDPFHERRQIAWLLKHGTLEWLRRNDDLKKYAEAIMKGVDKLNLFLTLASI